MIPTYAMLATKNRPELVRGCIRSLLPQVGRIVVVDNNDVPDGFEDFPVDTRPDLIHHPGYPPNLSELYNVGLDIATLNAWEDGNKNRWNVVIINDDAEAPPRWVESLEWGMEATGAALAYTDRLGRQGLTHYKNRRTEFAESATVWACLLRGDLGIRFDEELQWWYNDNWLDLTCRFDYGGTVAVPGQIPVHHHPDEQTRTDGVLAEQTGHDRVAFDRKCRERGW